MLNDTVRSTDLLDCELLHSKPFYFSDKNSNSTNTVQFYDLNLHKGKQTSQTATAACVGIYLPVNMVTYPNNAPINL